jgi:cytochrome bd-I ubiquinol oxidase subunit X
MWYFSWILGLGLACAFAILNAMWLELESVTLYLGFRSDALGSGWERSQVQTVRWRLFQTAGKIVRHAGHIQRDPRALRARHAGRRSRSRNAVIVWRVHFRHLSGQRSR